MNETWRKFLSAQGAMIENNQVVAFTDERQQIYSLLDTYLCELSTFGIIHAAGEDAQTFLHGQLTNDLHQVTPALSQLSSYCNPKGRMLAIFRIYKKNADYFMLLPRDVLAATIKRLTLFRLMSKVELMDDSDQWVVFGLAGPVTRSLLANIGLTMPSQDGHCIHERDTIIIRIPSESTRILMIANPQTAITYWQQLASQATLATADVWDVHDIHCGLPSITENTYEVFIPQMTNLELIGGVSFSKGCYPGQEVVARTHYLGKPNRRMYRVTIEDKDAPAPGTNLYASEDETQPVGKVVMAKQTSSDQSSALVVLRTAKENSTDLHLGSISGSRLAVQSLPYSLVPEAN